MLESTIIKFILIFGGFILCCILLILIIRSILELVIYVSYKNYKKIKNKAQKIFPAHKKNFIKEDEELILKKDEVPRAHSQVKADKIRAKQNQQYQILDEEMENEKTEKIVGVGAPMGFWTRKIFGERIATILAQVESMKKGESTDFWKNFVKASRQQARFQNNSNHQQR